MRALVIDEPWISAILRGEKTWEMRKRPCRFQERIALIRKGSGLVVGTAVVSGSGPTITTRQAYAAAEPKHRIPPERQDRAFVDGWTTPWLVSDVRSLRAPVPYRHPSGAVVWVTLTPEVAAKLAATAQ